MDDADRGDPVGGPHPWAHLDRSWLIAKPGVKWARCTPHGALAAWVADMDVPPAPPVLAALGALVAGGDLGYPDWPQPGASPLRAAFVARMADRYGWRPDPDGLVELNDVVQGVQVALHLGTSPGDGVVLHTPSYPPFVRSITAMGRVPVPVPAVFDGGRWVFDLDDLEARLRRTPARALLLCHPHNPTGRVFDRAELERLAAIAERHDLLVVADEIHAELVHDPHVHVPFASLHDDAAARTVTVTSASKAFNLAGLRWAVAHVGHAGVRAGLRALPDHVFGVPNLAAVAATTAAWTEGDAWLADLRAHLDVLRRRVAAGLDRVLPAAVHAVPEATYLTWIDCRPLGLGEEPYDAFLRAGVRLSPGPDFGAPGFVRLNFATSTDVVDEVLERMGAVAEHG